MDTMFEESPTPLVSFVVTTFNLPTALLRECIGSITALSLSESEREIILVDDGSDCSPVDELVAERDAIVYLRQRNQGLSAARNLGLRMARGTYVQFVDGDDRLIRAPYEHCLDIARYHDPDLVLFRSTPKAAAATPFAYEGPLTGSEYMRSNNLRAAAWGYLFRRSLLGESLRFVPGIYHEDEDFTPQLFLRAERLFTTESEAYFYRQRPGSIVHSDNPERLAKRLADTECVLRHLQSLLDTVPEGDRQALSRRIAQLTMDYLYNTIRLTHDRRLLEATIGRLSDCGLYPLPDRDYTRKYRLFRRAIMSPVLRRALFLVIR